jgi:hypothetical protein
MIKDVKLIDIASKTVDYDNKLEVYRNGIDNVYPDKVGRLINNSVTAKMASKLMAQYLIGKGYGETVNETIINKDKNITFLDFADDVAEDFTNHGGAFIHVNYEMDDEGNYKQVNPRVLPFDQCRVGKKDSNGYSGKIHVKKDWTDSSEEAVKYDVYNDKDAVITAQSKASQPSEKDGLKRYKGQSIY